MNTRAGTRRGIGELNWVMVRQREGEEEDCAVGSQGAGGLAWPSHQPSPLRIPQSAWLSELNIGC